MTACDYQHFDLVTTTPQYLTENWANIGEEINILAYDNIAVYLSVTDSDSSGIQIKPVCRVLKGDEDVFDLPLKNLTDSGITEIHTLTYSLMENDTKISFDIDVKGLSFIQLQAKASIAGASPGRINYCRCVATARV